MNGISSDKRLLKVYFNSTDLNDREAKSYLSSIQKRVLFVDLTKNSLTQRQWAEILDDLELSPSKIVDQNHELLQDKNGKKVDLSLEDWLDVLVKSPQIIMGTIIIEGDKSMYFRTPKELIEFVAARPESQNDSRE